MRQLTLLLAVLSTFLLSSCVPDVDDDDDTPPELPAVIPGDWFTGMEGTITNRKEFLTGALEGDSCTETFELTGLNVTEVLPENCDSCDLSYSVFMGLVAGTDCNGGDDLEEEGKVAFDLRQESGEAVFYWYFEGWWSSEWVELGTGSLERDDENLAFNFHFEWDDPDNGNWAGNYTADDPCSWTETCTWDGFYTSDIVISFDWLEDDEALTP